jgi:hypothetical protein
MDAISATLVLMRCPSCFRDDQTEVLTIRHRLDGSIRRRHTCARCELRWTASEELIPGSITRAPLPAHAAARRAA